MASLLSERMAIVATIDPVDAATSAVNSDYVDMSKFSRLMAVVMAGAITGTIDGKLTESTDGSGGSEADITGKAITQLSATDDNKQGIINIHESELSAGFDFVRLVLTPTGGTTNLAGAIILGGDASHEPASDNDLASVAEIVS